MSYFVAFFLAPSNILSLFFLCELIQFKLNKESPALFSQGRANFSGRNEAISFPPQHLEFVSGDDGSGAWIRTGHGLVLKNLSSTEIVPIIS